MRTKECLGYFVICFFNYHTEGGSFDIIVQSQKCHPNQIIASIHDFLRNVYEETIATKQFEQVFSEIKVSVEKKIKSSMVTVSETFKKFWKGVQKGDLHYNEPKQQLQALSEINYLHFRSLYYSGVLDATTRKILTIVLYRENHKVKLNVDCLIQYHLINQSIKTLESSCL